MEWGAVFVGFSSVNDSPISGFFARAYARYSSNVLYDFFYYTSGVVMVLSVIVGIRTVSDEVQLKTSPALFLSPVSDRDIIYGKFLGSFFLLLVFMAFTLYMPAMIFINGKVSLGHLACGYLGLIILAAACLSISILSSSVSPNLIMSSVCAGSILVFLLVVWVVALKVPEPFKSIFSFIALHNQHFPSFARGVVSLEHLGYYFLVSFFSLSWAGFA